MSLGLRKIGESVLGPLGFILETTELALCETKETYMYLFMYVCIDQHACPCAQEAPSLFSMGEWPTPVSVPEPSIALSEGGTSAMDTSDALDYLATSAERLMESVSDKLKSPLPT